MNTADSDPPFHPGTLERATSPLTWVLLIPEAMLGKIAQARRRPPTLLDSLKDNRAALPLLLYLRRLSSEQRTRMLEALNLLVQSMSDGTQNAVTFDWRDLRAANLPGISDLTPCFPIRQISRMKRGLIHVSREAWRLGDLEESELTKITNTSWMRIIPRSVRITTVGNVETLLAACARDRSARGARDAAMVTVLWETQLRICDVVTLSTVDYQSGFLVMGEYCRRLSEAAQFRLSEWQLYRDDFPGPLFVSITRAGDVQMHAMTASAVAWALKRRAAS